MSRAFFSLYFLIVLSIVTLGWGLDRLWEYYQPQETFSDVKILQLQDFANSALLERISSGEQVAFDDEEGKSYLYQKLDGQTLVLSIEQSPPPAPWFEMALGFIFYLAIAVAIFGWVWPLSRDLSKLEKHTRTLGTELAESRVSLPQQSAAYSLASAFNRMSDRILYLLNIQKEMTNAVSHELRTPLARMKFALAMATDSKDLTQIKSRLGGIKEDITEMDELVNQLLNYANFDQSNPTLDWKRGDMQSLIQQIVQRLTAHDSSIEVKVQVQVLNLGCQTRFNCDWHLMERAVLNLIQNGLRHCRNTLNIALDKVDHHFVITVDDDGVGIPEASRKAVFESFVRLRNPTEGQTSGFGLGLTIVRRIMQWHHGEVSASESPLGGARFTLRWLDGKSENL